MKRFSMNELTTYRWTLEEDVQHYVEVGIPAISVWRDKLADFGEERGVDLILESGLAVAALQWAGGFTGSDGRSYKESIQDAREAIQLARVLGAGCLIVYSGARGGHTANHARRLLRGALTELIPVAKDQGVVLALEPMHPGCATDWTFMTDLREAVTFVRNVQDPQLQLVFDTYQWGHEPGLLEQIPELASLTAIVQLGDAKCPPDGEQNRCRLGEGRLPLGEVVRTFVRSGFSGYFDVELMGEEIEASDYHDLLVHSRSVVESFL